LSAFARKILSKQKQKECDTKNKMQSIAINQNKELEEFIEGDYISIKEGESRVLEFDINKIKLVDRTDFNGSPVKKVQFIVIIANPEDPQQRRERKFELSRKHVPKIYNELKKGKTVLEIFRTGLGKQTEYHVKAIR
jgi:hypothetical protein